MNREPLRALEPCELAKLQAFAAVEGRRWKERLQAESWWRGLPCRDRTGREYPHLYGLRNTHGPIWLERYRLPKEGRPC